MPGYSKLAVRVSQTDRAGAARMGIACVGTPACLPSAVDSDTGAATMPRTAIYGLSSCLLAVSFLWSTPATPQEGHPLVGSWHGGWSLPDAPERRDLTVIMDWDGEVVTGLVNPVTDRGELENARLDSGDWSVHFEVEMRGEGTQTLRCVADGQIDKLGSDQRTLAGTWVCGGGRIRAEFQLTRDRDY